MRCNSKNVLSLITLTDLYRLNFLDDIILREIKNETFDELKFFSNKKSAVDIPFIIKLANASLAFTNICKKEIYNDLWAELYSQIGLFLSFSEENIVVFYQHKNIDNFDLLRGAFFFYCSQQVRTTLSSEFSNSEIIFLKEAIQFKSVHAIQRYNSFIYNKIANDQLPEGEEAKILLVKAINYSKSILKPYGSYAYMLLAEAFYHYAIYSKNNGEVTGSCRALQSAITACNNATKYIEKSRFSIYNASFGKGLGYSNSFGISSPEEAKIILESMLENISNNTTLYKL